MVLPDEPMWASGERTSIPIEDQAIAALGASPPLPHRSIIETPDKFVDTRLLGIQIYISIDSRPYSFAASSDFSNGYSPTELKYKRAQVTFADIIGMPAGAIRNKVVRLFIKYFENERLHDSQDMAAAIDPTNGFVHVINGEAIGWNLFAGRQFVHISLGHGMSMVLQLRRIVYKAWIVSYTFFGILFYHIFYFLLTSPLYFSLPNSGDRYASETAGTSFADRVYRAVSRANGSLQ